MEKEYCCVSDNDQVGGGNASPQVSPVITRDQAVNAVKPLAPESEESEETRDKNNAIQQLPVLKLPVDSESTSSRVAEKRKPVPGRYRLSSSPTHSNASSSVTSTSFGKMKAKVPRGRPSFDRHSSDVTFIEPEENLNDETLSDEIEIIDIISSGNRFLMVSPSGGKQSPENNNNSDTQDQQIMVNILNYLECQVCQKFSVSPIKSCINSHIICGSCMESMEIVECIICKSGQFFPCPLGEKMAEDAAVQVKCRYVDAGCDKKMLSTKAMDHIQECYYREVECHEYPVEKCRGEKIPLLDIPKHLNEKHAIRTSHNSKLVLNLLHGEILYDSAWACDLIHFDEKYFVSHAVVACRKFYAWLTILGSPDQAEKYQSKVILEEPEAPNHLVPKRIKLQEFVFKLPVFPHQDFPRLPSFKGSQLTELISVDTLQKWSVSRDEIVEETASNKYAFKLRIEVMKASTADEDK